MVPQKALPKRKIELGDLSLAYGEPAWLGFRGISLFRVVGRGGGSRWDRRLAETRRIRLRRPNLADRDEALHGRNAGRDARPLLLGGMAGAVGKGRGSHPGAIRLEPHVHRRPRAARPQRRGKPERATACRAGRQLE